ncbi:MAG: hypothetical protein WBO48_15755 [Candidatus Promineifilaceae bacterium]|nr:hypothetical protein [Chloroflexota bacterium]
MTLNAIPGEGQGGVFAGGDDDVNLGRQVFQKKGEGIVNGFGVNPVVIIADKDDGVETAVNSFNKPVKIDSMDGGCGDCRAATTPSPSAGTIVCKVATL